MNDIYLILFAHSFVRHLSCFHLLAVVHCAAVNMDMQILFKTLHSILLDIYPEVGLLDHMEVLFLISLGTSTLLFTVAVPVYTHNSVKILSFLHNLISICFVFNNGHPNKYKVLSLWF